MALARFPSGVLIFAFSGWRWFCVGEGSWQFPRMVVSGLVSAGIVCVVFVWLVGFSGFQGLFFSRGCVHCEFEFLGTCFGFTHSTIFHGYHFFLFNPPFPLRFWRGLWRHVVVGFVLFGRRYFPIYKKLIIIIACSGAGHSF